MKLPDLFPPPDLLQRIDGVEDGLRKRRRLGVAGVLGVLVSALTWLTNLRNAKQVDLSNLASDWPLLLGVVVFVTSVLLAIWARFWLQESRRPFLYSYYVEHFEPVEGTVTDPRLAFLAADLSERLSERIMRLSRFDERAADPKVVAERTSHLHVTGYYLIRLDADRRWVVEITPWVRLGPIGERETLALPVKVPIGGTAEADPGRPSRWGRGADLATPTHAAEPPVLTVELYDTLLERVYFSIATQVYKQIRHDVQRKIDLLPTRYFRAVAYHNEARDYAQSNTLDAYEAARDLYDAAITMYDPYWAPGSPGRLRRLLVLVRKGGFRLGRGVRTVAAVFVPRARRLDVMIARAKIGYADMILYRHILAGMSGQTLSSIFEARPVAQDAVEELERLKRPDIPDRQEALFDAYVTLASVYFYLGSIGVDWRSEPVGGGALHVEADADARGRVNGPPQPGRDEPSAFHYLREARRLDPGRSERHAQYQFVLGKLQPRIPWELRFLRRAFELDQKFEVAQFELALRSEMLWRMRSTLEENVADLVVAEYKRVLRVNPGNISALGRLGDIYWLLAPSAPTSRERADRRQLAKDAFNRGRDNKLIHQETFVAELDYGLARIAAEAGDFAKAYEHYVSAASAHVAFGVAHARGGYTAQFHFFDRINDTIQQRYERYLKKVQEQADAASDGAELLRMQNVVLGFARNDYGEACLKHWLRFGRNDMRAEAAKQFKEADELVDGESVFPAYNAYLLELYGADFEPAVRWIEKVNRLEPEWLDGRIAKRALYSDWARNAQFVLEMLDPDIKELETKAAKLKERRRSWGRTSSATAALVQLGTAGVPTTGGNGGEGGHERLSSPGNFDKAYTTLLDEIQAVQQSLEKLKRRREVQRRYYENAARETRRNPDNEVPHAWLEQLWTDPRPATLHHLDRESARARWRWERELNDVHVRALINWASTQWILPQNGPDGPAGSDHHVDPDKRRFSRSLLERLQDHFWPDDRDLLAGLRRMMHEDKDDRAHECNERLWRVFRREFEEDPRYIIIREVMFDEASSPESRRTLMKDVTDFSQSVKPPEFNADAWFDLGDRLIEWVGDKDTAKAAYRQAIERGEQCAQADGPLKSQDPELDPAFYVRLGDRLADLGVWKDSERAYELAMRLDGRHSQ
jgi:tetratricopeptide (TPR) repeat protein